MNLVKIQNFILVLVLCLICYCIRDAIADSRYSGDFYPYGTIAKTALFQRYEPSSFVIHSYPTYGLTISAPSDWEESTKPQFINEIVSYLSPVRNTEDTYRENVMITMRSYLGNLTSAGFIDAALLKLQELENFEIINSEREFKLGGYPAYKFMYSFEENRRPYTGLQVGTVANSTHNIQIIYTAELGTFAEYIPTVNRMINSVTLRLPDNANGNATWTDYSSGQNNLTLSYPPDWNRAREGFLSSVLTIYPSLDNVNDTYFDNVRIIIANLLANVTLEANVNKSIADFNKTFDNFKLKENSNTTLAGNRANKLIYTYTTSDSTENHQAERIVTINNNKSYVILLDTSPDKFSTYLPTFDKILSSVKIGHNLS